MATAADIIKGALRLTGIIAAETPIEADEMADGLSDLNDWASQFEVSTLPLGFSSVQTAADEVNIPSQAVSMYKTNLALYMASQYGAPITQTLANAANDTLNNALIMFAPKIDVEFPDTLPMGEGNQCDEVQTNRRFFPPNNKENF